jgi:hypothetical protein
MRTDECTDINKHDLDYKCGEMPESGVDVIC